MDCSDQMDRATAVAGLIVFVGPASRLVGTTYGRAGKFQAWVFVIVDDVVVADDDVGGGEEQNAFILGVLDCESGDDHIMDARIIEAVHKNAVRQVRGVNGGRPGPRAQKRQRFADGDLLIVGAGGDLD